MRELIAIHIGQAGVQLSSTVWETFCIEHNIMCDGNLKSENQDVDDLNFGTFFQEVPTGQFVPRAVSIDLEPSVLDEIRTGPYRKLFHPDQMVSGFEDAANNFARGHYTLGKDHIDYAINRIRKCVDMCECLEGFFIFNSYGGGTGSGFSALMLERLSVEFTKNSTFQTAIYPGERMSTATVEPYNSLLCTISLVENLDLCNIFDNESLYNICCNNLDIPRPTYSNLNRIIAQIISAMTVSVRFESYLNAELGQMVTNLVPYPRIHFPVFTHAPLVSSRKANHQPMTTAELTRAAFDSSNQLVSCNMSEGRYMCCCLQYRGCVTPREVNDAIFEIKRRTDIKFVEWCPTGFKLGLNCHPPAFIPRSEIAETTRSLTTLSNSTAIAQKFRCLSKRFDILFNKRSFLYWYIGEGMEEAEFINCRDEINAISSDYEEIAIDDDSTDKVVVDGLGDEVEGNTKEIDDVEEESDNVDNEEESPANVDEENADEKQDLSEVENEFKEPDDELGDKSDDE